MTMNELDLHNRITALEEVISEIPCRIFNHHNFPIDEEYELDEEGFEVCINVCRNCGEKV